MSIEKQKKMEKGLINLEENSEQSIESRLLCLEEKIDRILNFFENEKITSFKEAAKVLAVDYRTVKKLCSEGLIATTADGRKVRMKSVIDYIHNK